MNDDAELLRRYAEGGDEHAFGELVGRYLSLVYSVALRLVGGDRQHAQDIAQSVFADLARKSKSLAKDVARGKPLIGWLYTSTRFAASRLCRTERRRLNREQLAFQMNERLHSSADEKLWADLRPVIDEAIGQLRPSDRDLILLRFFEGRDFANIGAAIGRDEEAVRKRVSRALEKLRTILKSRGVTTTTAGLAAALAANTIHAAPVELVSLITAASLASGFTVSSVSTANLLYVMGSAKIKALVLSLAVIGAGSFLTVQQLKVNELRAANAVLSQQIVARRDTNPTQPLSNSPVENAPSSDPSELIRLRGEVNQLRGTIATLRAAAQKPEDVEDLHNRLTSELQVESRPGTPFAPNHYYASELWSDVGLDTPEAVLQTALAAVKSGNIQRLVQTLNLSDTDHAVLAGRWTPEALKEFPGASAIGVKVEAFGGTLSSPKIEYIVEFDNGQALPATRAHFTLENQEGKWRLASQVPIEGPGDAYLVPK